MVPLHDYDVAPFSAPDKIVAGAALEDEMFKVRRKRNVARNAINPTDVLVAGALSDDNLFQTAPYGYSLDV